MASSDDEGETFPVNVSNYAFQNSRKEPILFSVLPLYWTDTVIEVEESPVAFLTGASDGGLQQVYKQAIGWKVDLCCALPEVYVLSKGKTWMRLQKPRKSYEVVVKSVLIVVWCLHFAKRNVLASRKEVLSHLREKLSLYEVESLEKCLSDHLPLIMSAVANDEDLARSKYLEAFLIGVKNPGRKPLHEEIQTTSKSEFIISDDEDEDQNDSEEEEAEGLFDSVCAFCDNGGDILPCEGQCMRTFHPTVDAGIETSCESLGFENAAQYEAIATFYCANCKHRRHQCFVCGQLGSSDKSSAEVFPCVSATCGHFYHPKCVADLLHPSDEALAGQLKSQIAAGGPFTCPIHKCRHCQQGEDKDDPDMQFAVCARCPKAYHRMCLPMKIAFVASDDGTIQQRAWDGLLPNRILMYCLKHKIIPKMGTPSRDHLLFPSIVWKRNQDGSRTKMMSERRSRAFGNFSTATHGDTALEKGKSSTMYKQTSFSENNKSIPRNSEQPSNIVRIKLPTKDMDKEPRFPSKRVKETAMTIPKVDAGVKTKSLKSLTKDMDREPRFPSKPVKETAMTIPKVDTGMKTKSLKLITKDMDREPRLPSKPVNEMAMTIPKVDAEMKTKILKLMNDSTSSTEIEEFIKAKKERCTYSTYSSQHGLDKTITVGNVERYVKAVRAALKILEDGGSIEDAKKVCEPNVLHKLTTWKKKLQVYLAPFLIGARYTSFGRHFTKVDKLKEIVDRLHWYVEDGDTIVDFCCGSNDFSWLMKEILDSTGKKCNFKNFDLHTPKNAFNFEKRDWFSVPVGALPDGSGLVMGLNPPFGVRASLANKFIQHALKFKPKLIILIVPEETKRLDCMRYPYDLIWEERNMLSGKSFYLPGSVDNKDQTLDDWNCRPPPLSLWSRPDWTAKHRALARKHSHIEPNQPTPPREGESRPTDYLLDYDLDDMTDFCNMMNDHPDITSMLDNVMEEPDAAATQPNCENTNIRSQVPVDVAADMDLSTPIISPENTRPEPMKLNPPSIQPGNHLGFTYANASDPYGPGVRFGGYGGFGYPQSGHYTNHGYPGGTSNYGQLNCNQPEFTSHENVWAPGTAPRDSSRS